MKTFRLNVWMASEAGRETRAPWTMEMGSRNIVVSGLSLSLLHVSPPLIHTDIPLWLHICLHISPSIFRKGLRSVVSGCLNGKAMSFATTLYWWDYKFDLTRLNSCFECCLMFIRQVLQCVCFMKPPTNCTIITIIPCCSPRYRTMRHT